MLQPAPGSTREIKKFAKLQARLPAMFETVFADSRAPRTVVIVPSLSLDQDVLATITGVRHYEERMLCLLLLLRLPRTEVIFLSSTPISDAIIDYYLHLLPGVLPRHARRRLTMIDCNDPSATALTDKILGRPDILEEIRRHVKQPDIAHMTCFNVTERERTLAVQLDVPIYGCDPALLYWGSKSGSRRIFKDVGINLADGAEELANAGDVANALVELRRRNPNITKALVKLNEGFSGEGNGMFSFDHAPPDDGLGDWVRARLSRLEFVAKDMTWKDFERKIGQMGAIVENYIDGREKRSPSAQFRIDPLGHIEVISTHDQVLDDLAGQTFIGCTFPADEAYRLDIQNLGLKAAHALRDKGVIGRFGVDFLSVREGNQWRHRAIEINLRKGGNHASLPAAPVPDRRRL